MALALRQFSVLSFDCYGTLIDWESGIAEALEPLAHSAKALRGTCLTRDEQLLAYAQLEADQEHLTPGLAYRDLLALVYARIAKQWGVVSDAADAQRFAQSVGAWPAFPDTVAALAYLKQHFKLVILSNVDRRSFALTLPRLGVAFDAIYTAEDIGSYKPSLANFEYLLAHIESDLNAGKADLLHVAQSLFHDHAPANQLKIASAYIDRRHAKGGWGATPQPTVMPCVDFRFTSLRDLATAHQESLAGP